MWRQRGLGRQGRCRYQSRLPRLLPLSSFSFFAFIVAFSRHISLFSFYRPCDDKPQSFRRDARECKATEGLGEMLPDNAPVSAARGEQSPRVTLVRGFLIAGDG